MDTHTAAIFLTKHSFSDFSPIESNFLKVLGSRNSAWGVLREWFRMNSRRGHREEMQD